MMLGPGLVKQTAKIISLIAVSLDTAPVQLGCHYDLSGPATEYLFAFNTFMSDTNTCWDGRCPVVNVQQSLYSPVPQFPRLTFQLTDTK